MKPTTTRPSRFLTPVLGALLTALPMGLLADAGASCTALLSVQLALPGDAQSLTIDASVLVPDDGTLPEHCQVNGHIDAEINFLMKLPTTWNGKILMSGNSAFAGSFDSLNPWVDDGLVRSYAVIGTDTGHSGGPEELLNRPDRIANLQYRSVHLVALTAKELAAAYYGAGASHSYFEGCSRGGIQAMKEAADYPEDFDGIIAGAPGFPSGGFRLWNMRALFPNGPSSGVLPGEKVALLASLTLQKCDGLDGLVDGLVDDPRKCNLSPDDDLPKCKHDVDHPDCFTRAQIQALSRIHGGPRSNGQRLGTKFFFSGVEGFDYGDAFGVGVDILDFSYWASGFPGVPDLYPDFIDVGIPSVTYWLESETLQNITFSDPGYLLQQFDYDDSSSVAAYQSSLASQFASSPDLSAFRNRGGKLIQWHGWGDPNINAMGSVTFYKAGANAVGGINKMKTFDRLFMVPGTSHCGGGPGPWNFDPLIYLEQWVEQSIAPDSLVGSNPDSGMTRPICAYPNVARLKNPSLDPNVASNFKCVKGDD